MPNPPLRRISPSIPALLYLQVQSYREPRNIPLRSIVEDALLHALENDIAVPALPPQSQQETTAVVARIEEGLFLRAKLYCAAKRINLRSLVAAALTAYLPSK